jgi:bifunctional non-homologous end joining protein LigD
MNPTATNRNSLRVAEREVPAGNVERVFYPQTETTKAEVLTYFIEMGEYILPLLRDRPLSLRRFPEGVEAEGFWQKHCPVNRPGWLHTAEIEGSSGTVNHCLAPDLPSLLWLVGQGTLELHTTLHRHGRKRPDFALFDLDPGPGRDLLDCGGLGLRLRDYLASRGLQSFVKSSGKKGLHLMVPLKGSTDYPDVKEFASRVAHEFESSSPELVTATMAKAARTDKIFIDWSQNDPHKTTVTAFSPRAADRPTISTPLEWDEVEAALERDDPSGLVADIYTAPARAKLSAGIMDQVLNLRQSSRLLTA